MMEKVKLTQEQANAVDSAAANYTFEESMENRLAGWNAPTRRCLNKLSVEELATALLVGYEVEPIFEVGDWVVIEDSKNPTLTGKTLMITYLGKTGIETRITYDVSSINGNWTIERNTKLRHATPEEIKAEKERRVWSKIGREVGDFRLGDSYEKNNGTLHTFDKPARKEVIMKMYSQGDFKASTQLSPSSSLEVRMNDN